MSGLAQATQGIYPGWKNGCYQSHNVYGPETIDLVLQLLKQVTDLLMRILAWAAEDGNTWLDYYSP